MYRTSLENLKKWFGSKPRKPLVLRGARQVGKTWLVRHFAETEGLHLVEINLERQPSLAKLFESNNPEEILRQLSAKLNVSIDFEKSLLFIDEIQATPELYAKLRWFAEDMPELALIAAGSLLEIVLQQNRMSMPVGRVSFLFLEPLSFIEFLAAKRMDLLIKYIQSFTWSSTISEVVHDEIMKHFKEYLVVGGMPRAVYSWITNNYSMEALSQIHKELFFSYREDFLKYGKPRLTPLLNDVMEAVPRNLATKFVLSNINRQERSTPLKEALILLSQARICHIIYKTDANGLPLGAGINRSFFKVIFLDVGLCSAALNYSLELFESAQEIEFINSGGIAEQVVGQSLRGIEPFYNDPQLYYWARPEKGAEAEIDYIIQHKGSVVPLEVKAGTTGTLKSLHMFMELKKLPLAVRINSDIPRKHDIRLTNVTGNPVQYELRSLPFYLISELHRLLD